MASEGLSGFFRGYWVSLATYAPSSALFWLTYTNAKKAMNDFSPPSPTAPPDSGGAMARTVAIQASSGFLGGIVSGTLTNPMDVVRTRLQVSVTARATGGGGGGGSGGSGGNAAPPGKATFSGVVRGLWADGGIAAFSKGVTARVAYAAPASALMASMYEVLKRICCNPALDSDQTGGGETALR